jgi:hypothetical protein
VASGTNVVTAVSTALTSAGIDVSQAQLTPTSHTTPEIREWPIGTSYLRIVNDLLSMIAYRGIHFDGNGNPVVEPYVLPAQRSSEYTYATDENSVILDVNVEANSQIAGVPNVVVLTRANPGTATLTSTQTNSKVSSPTSTVRRGLSTVLYEQADDAADQTALDNMAKRRLTEVSEVLMYVSFSTTPHPFHDDLDKIRFTHQTDGVDSLDIDDDFIETEWRLSLSEVGEMVHRARVSVNVI